MKFERQKHHRRSIRLRGYDYAQTGGYFVTLVTRRRECSFGKIVDEKMHLNAAGRIVEWEWRRLALRFEFIELGVFVVMPNHIHGILIFNEIGATRSNISKAFPNNAHLHPQTLSANPKESPLLNFHDVATRLDLPGIVPAITPLQNQNSSNNHEGSPLPHPAGPAPASLGAIIGQFKSRVTKRLWKIPKLSNIPIWQRNYYEHIIRDADEANRIYLYIEANPANWPTDEENPVRIHLPA